MNKNLNSLLILFVSICIIYVFRIYRDIKVILDKIDANDRQSAFFICKIVLVMGICFSLYMRVGNSAVYTNDRTNSL
jgi:hypothetical protein